MAEVCDQAWSWASSEGKVSLAKRRRTMYHRSIGDSSYITGATVRKYRTTRDDLTVACAVASAMVKYQIERDFDLMARIIREVRAFHGVE
jgi:hypothetical protein